MFQVSFDSKSLREMTSFAGLPALFAEEIQGTMKQVGDRLSERAQAKTWDVFKEPMGELASTIAPIAPSPFEVQIGVGVPCGRRLELGFVGTDSLGRNYNQAPEPYLQPTLNENAPEVEDMFAVAIEQVLSRITGNA